MTRREYLITIPLLCLGFVALATFNWTRKRSIDPHDICIQPPKLVPNTSFHDAAKFFDKSYASKSAELLGGAVRIPTESYDDMSMDPPSDPRYDAFYNLSSYLQETFPLATKHGNLEFINTFGMLYTFKGHASAHVLKPALFMGHLDVVPVNRETQDQWSYGPFSGYYDGEWIYGRGAGDTKNTVVGILEAVESLLQQGWTPARTVLISFGFDEEIGGYRGAGHLSQKILSRYGPDSIELIVDEGFGNLESEGLRLACPLVTERGYMDIDIAVQMHGGHSSMPPDHTSIGVISEFITQLEDDPFEPTIKDWTTHPAAALFQCVARYSPDIGAANRSRFLNLNSRGNVNDLIDFISEQPGATKFMIRTSQAVDVIHGGVKVNALPENVVAKVNYRSSIDSTPAEVYNKVLALAARLVSEFDLGLVSDGKVLSSGGAGNLTVAPSRTLEAAPISPWTGTQWDIITGTMRHIFEDLLPSNLPLVIAPSMMTGNTDTKHYWDLTKHIYRYTPVDQRDMLDYHTVNERLRLRAHLATVAWYYELLQHLTI